MSDTPFEKLEAEENFHDLDMDTSESEQCSLETPPSSPLMTPPRRMSPRRGTEGNTNKYFSGSEYMRNKPVSPKRKTKATSKKESSSLPIIVDFHPFKKKKQADVISPEAKQKLQQALRQVYPNSIFSGRARKALFVDVATKIKVKNDTEDKIRGVSIYLDPEAVDFAMARKTVGDASKRFKLNKKKYAPHPTVEEVARPTSTTIDENAQNSREPIRKDLTNFGEPAIRVAQQYKYPDKSIWNTIDDNRFLLSKLLSIKDDKAFHKKLNSKDYREVNELLAHNDVIENFKKFMTNIPLTETIKLRFTLLMLLRTYQLCHKQPHHTLSDERLAAQPYLDDTTSAPCDVNKLHIHNHEHYIDLLTEEGYEVHSTCQPTMFKTEVVDSEGRTILKPTRLAQHLKHTLQVKNGGNTLSFVFKYDCDRYSLPLQVNRIMAPILIEHYSAQIENSNCNNVESKENNQNIENEQSVAKLLSKSSSIISPIIENNNSSKSFSEKTEDYFSEEDVITPSFKK